MKRTMNRLFARLAILCVAVILGAVAVSQAQRGLQQSAGTVQTGPPTVAVTQPIPPADLAPLTNTVAPNDPYGVQSAPQENAYAAEPAYVPETPSYSDAPNYPEPPAATNYGADPGYGADAADLSAYQDPPPEPDYGAAYAAEAPPTAGPPVAEVQYVAEALPPSLPALPQNEITPDLPPITPPGEPSLPNLDSFTSDTGPTATANDLPPIDSLPADPPVALVPDPPMTREVGYPSDGYGTGASNSQDNGYAAQTSSNSGNMNVAPNIAPIGGFDSSTNNSYGGPTGAATLNVGSERMARSNRNQFSNQSMGMDGMSRSGGPTGMNGMHGPSGNGKPGPTALEGPQSPTLVVTKNAPPEVQVGKVAKFEVTVRNVGAVDAKDVVIRDEVPHGAQLVETIPAAGKTANGSLMWEMGTIKAGGEVTVVMQIMPTAEGDIGSVATVSFQAAASAKSIATRPQLTLEHTGPGQVLVGGDVIFHIKITNPGSGVANNVVVTEDVPAGLRHADGRQLEYQIGSLRPGETRLLELTLKADQAGMVDNLLIAKADSNIRVEDRCPVEIVAPNLRIGIEGPRRRYLERRATFEIKVANPGTAPAQGVELVANMPRGLKFVSTNNAGQYNSQNHTVRWSLAELPAGEMGVVQLTAIPEEIGNQRIRAETRAQMGLTDATDHDLDVEGLAAILFTVTDATDPIEVGGQTTYEIRIVNQGSKIGNNVQIAAMIPDGMTAINGEGPTRVQIRGQQLIFEPLPRLAPQGDAFYKIHVKGTTPGDKRIRVQLMSDDVQQPVTKEESTHVYSDQ